MGKTLALPVLPLDDVVVLPGMVVPIRLSGADANAEARAAVEAATAAAETGTKARILLVPRLDGKYAKVGTLALIEQVGRLSGGERAAVVRGTERVRIGTGTTGPGAALWVEATVADTPAVDDRTDELAREYRALVTTILQQRGAWQVVDSVQQVDEPSALADLAGYATYVTEEQKVWLLETNDVNARLEKLLVWGREYLAELDVAETIRKDVKEGMEKQQREFLLRQQLAAIRKELAELDGKPATEEQDYRARVEAAVLPDAVREAVMREAAKLERTSEQSPESGWIRTWLDTVLDL
ncbi:MAG: LON peptidase substrate-binding domain-containing protein, partial [Umezawaea sp.]